MTTQFLWQTNKVAQPPNVKDMLQRKCACGNHTVAGGKCEDCRKKREDMVQRSAVNVAPVNEAPPIVHEVLRSPGQPLDRATREYMEPRFGYDFSNVRVHTDARAVESAQSVNALAYTVGRDVVFGDEQYAPHTNSGRRLMVHELTHVVQQKGAETSSDLRTSEPTGSAEIEAERVSQTLDNFQLVNENENPKLSRQNSSDRVQNIYPLSQNSGSETNMVSMDLFSLPSSEIGVLPRVSKTNTTILQMARPKRSLESRVSQLEVEQRRDKMKLGAIFQLGEFQQAVLESLEQQELQALSVGSAYSLAAERHRGALEGRQREQALKQQAFFSVLTVATAGGLAWLCESSQLLKKMSDLTKVRTEILEDVLQAAGGEAFSSMAPAFFAVMETPVSKDPMRYQNDMLMTIVQLRKAARGFFGQLNREFELFPPEFWDSFDKTRQQDRYSAWLLEQATLVNTEVELPSVDEMADELERGFWQKWLPSLETTKWVHMDFYDRGTEVPEFESPGSSVEGRLNKLGITEVAGIHDFGWWTSDAEISRLLDWARRYEVRPLLSLKKSIP